MNIRRQQTQTNRIGTTKSTQVHRTIKIDFSSTSDDDSESEIPMISSGKPAEVKRAPVVMMLSDSFSDSETPEQPPKPTAPQEKSLEPKDDDEYYYEEEEEEVVVKPKPKPPQTITRIPGSVTDSTNSVPSASNELKFYQIFREKSLTRTDDFAMMEDQSVRFFSHQDKDRLGKFHVITKTKRDKAIEGIVRIHEMRERFTVITNETKQNDDREAEVAGIAFTPKSKGSDRSCKLILTRDGKPSWPISKRRNLSRVASAALKADAPVGDKLKVYKSRGGILDFNSNMVVESCKNFIIEDEDGNIILMFYKTGDNQFAVKCRNPVTPLIAFGVAIAITTSK